MRCTNPLTLNHSNRKFSDKIAQMNGQRRVGTVPCGKCMACRIHRTKEWSIRLMHESYFHDENIFVTLTYDRENIPSNGEISKKEATNFIKRLRKHLGERKIRYYIAGEYGEQGRPHYHAIIFNLGLSDHDLRVSKRGYQLLKGPICKAWKKGFSYGGSVTPDSTRYVAKYIQKKIYGENAGPMQQPFSLKSNGLGRDWLEKNKDMLNENLQITFHGQNYPVPKYYAEKLNIAEDLRANNDYYWQKQLSRLDNKSNQPGESAVLAHKQRIQVNKNLLGYQKLYRGEL